MWCYQLFSSELSQKLGDDIQDGELDHFSLIEAAFIVSGVDNQQALTEANHWFLDLVAEMELKNIVVPMEPEITAERIFMYLQCLFLNLGSLFLMKQPQNSLE